MFTVSTDHRVNADGENYIAYLWHSVPDYSAIGVYTGTGETNGAFIETGFEPIFVMAKRLQTSASWFIVDSVRDTANPKTKHLDWAVTTTEQTNSNTIAFLKNGFHILGGGSDANSGGRTYQYMAFGHTPHKHSNSQ